MIVRTPRPLAILFLICLASIAPAGLDAKPAASSMPTFHTAAQARAWAEKEQRLGNYDLAAVAYDKEASLRAAEGDPQAAIVERMKANRLSTSLALAIPQAATA